MVLTAVQQGKYSVRIITDKSVYYTTGILQGYTDTNVSVKNTKNPPRFGFAMKKGQQCALSTLSTNAKLNRLTA